MLLKESSQQCGGVMWPDVKRGGLQLLPQIWLLSNNSIFQNVLFLPTTIHQRLQYFYLLMKNVTLFDHSYNI